MPCCGGGVQGVHTVFEVNPSSRCSSMIDLTTTDSCSDRLAMAEYAMLPTRYVGDDSIWIYHVANVPQVVGRWKRCDCRSPSIVPGTTWSVVVGTNDDGGGWLIRGLCLGPPEVCSYAQPMGGVGEVSDDEKRPLQGAAASLVGPVPGRGYLQSAEIGDDVLQIEIRRPGGCHLLVMCPLPTG